MLVQQDIRRFDIPVNHPFLVGIINGKTDRRKEIDDLDRRWNSSPSRGIGDVVGERLPLDVRHHHVGGRSV